MSFEPGLRPWKRKEGEGVQGWQGLPSRRDSGLEEEWSLEMDLEDEAESRKKLDEQKRKLIVCRKSFRKASRVTSSSSCRKWNKGGTISCQNISRTKKRNLQKDSTAAEEEMRKLQKEL